MRGVRCACVFSGVHALYRECVSAYKEMRYEIPQNADVNLRMRIDPSSAVRRAGERIAGGAFEELLSLHTRRGPRPLLRTRDGDIF